MKIEARTGRLRIKAIFPLALAALAAYAVAASGSAAGRKGGGPAREGAPKREAKPAKADSLDALRVLLSSEVKPGNEVLILKNPAATDSLLRNPAPRESFLRGLQDSSLAQEIRGPQEFSSYWNRIEQENGIPVLKNQMAAHDVDKSLIPKAYLFDSAVVVYPGWIIIRRSFHR